MNVPLNQPSIGAKEEEYVLDALRSGWVTTGKYVDDLESAFRVYTTRKHSVAVSSGTAALYLALRALGSPHHVLIPAYTCDAVCNAVLMAGGTPIVADVEAHTFGMALAGQILSGTKLDAVILPHTYGVPAIHSLEIEAICKERGIPLIEDASEAHGAKYSDGRFVGQLGDITIMSFRGEKTISGGQLGMVLTNEPEYARKVKQWSHNGLPSSKVRYWATEPGLNMQPANLNAALALAQFNRLAELVEKRNRVHGKWIELFSEFLPEQLHSGLFQAPGTHTPAWWLTAVNMSYVTRMLPQDLMVALEERGIQTRPGFYPLSWFPHMFKASTWSNPVAERLLRELLILPSGPDLTEDQMIYTMEMIGEVTDCWA